MKAVKYILICVFLWGFESPRIIPAKIIHYSKCSKPRRNQSKGDI